MERKAIIPLDKGLNYKDPRFLIPESQWASGLNARFNNGFVEKSKGWKKFSQSAITGGISNIFPYSTSAGESFLVFHTPETVHKLDAGDTFPVDITGEELSGLINGYSAVTVQDFYVFTNNVDPIMFWDGSGNAKKLPGATTGGTRANSTAYEKNDCVAENTHNYICITAGTTASSKPSFSTSSGAVITDGTAAWQEIGLSGLQQGGNNIDSCRFVVDFQGFLVCGDTTEDGTRFPQRLRWSQWDNCVRFKNNADSSGQAGWIQLPGADFLKNAVKLDNDLVIYRENSIWVMSFIGGSDIFQVTSAAVETGLLAQNAIVNLDSAHIFIGSNNVYSFDRMSVKPIGDNISPEFFRLLDPSYVGNIRGYHNHQENEVVFAFTSVNSTTNDMAIVLNTKTGAWGIRELPMSAFCKHKIVAGDQWDNDTETWDEDETKWDDAKNLTNSPVFIAADATGNIFELGGYSKDGGALPFYVETGLLSFDELTFLKRVKRIQLMVSRQGNYSLTVDVGTAASVDDEIVWKSSKTMSLTTTAKPWVDVDVTGRYFAIRLSNTDASQPVRITGMVIFYEMRGSV